MRAWLFLLYLTIASDMIAAVVVAIRLWSLRNGVQDRIMTLLSAVFFAMFLRGAFEFAASSLGYVIRPVYSIGYTICYWTGRAILTGAMWTLVVYLVGKRRDRL